MLLNLHVVNFNENIHTLNLSFLKTQIYIFFSMLFVFKVTYVRKKIKMKIFNEKKTVLA